MFEFLFKRQGEKPGNSPAAAAAKPAGKGAKGVADAQAGQGAAQQHPAQAKPSQQGREQQAEQLRQLDGDETRAVEFILSSDFSELRLAAAEHVHSRAALERVHGAMRNLDRRVAKLMQARLEIGRAHV